jgi:hypothetical protein
MSNQSDHILKFEALVPTREMCERLRDGGFDYLTRFYWVEKQILFERRAQKPLYNEVRLPAPTAAELGQVLPRQVRYEDVPYSLGVELGAVYYITGDERMMFAHKSARTEAEARARLWLRLESEGLLPEDDD